MRLMRLFLLSTLISTVTIPAWAATDPSPLSVFLSQYVYELTRPIYTWNWSNAAGRDPIWLTNLSAFSPAGIDHLKSTTSRYWQSFCSKNAKLNPPDCGDAQFTPDGYIGQGNMYGPGLYAAVDPVSTMSYGGGNQNWVLMQIRLPKGLRILDLQRDGSMNLPLKVQKYLLGLNCPAAWMKNSAQLTSMLSANETYKNGRAMFAGGDDHIVVSDECLLAIRKILKDDLQIDAFAYSYQGSEFRECDLPVDGTNYYLTYSQSGNNPRRQVAFVIANAVRFSSDDIRVFNSQTTDDREDRVRIQSLFYKADVDSAYRVAMRYFRSLSYPDYPGQQVSSLYPNCNWDSQSNKQSCKLQISMCKDGNNCQNVDAPSMPPSLFGNMETVMSSRNVPETLNPYAYSITTDQLPKPTLLWADLDGDPVDQTLSAWVTNQLFGCSQDLEYDSD